MYRSPRRASRGEVDPVAHLLRRSHRHVRRPRTDVDRPVPQHLDLLRGPRPAHLEHPHVPSSRTDEDHVEASVELGKVMPAGFCPLRQHQLPGRRHVADGPLLVGCVEGAQLPVLAEAMEVAAARHEVRLVLDPRPVESPLRVERPPGEDSAEVVEDDHHAVPGQRRRREGGEARRHAGVIRHVRARSRAEVEEEELVGGPALEQQPPVPAVEDLRSSELGELGVVVDPPARGGIEHVACPVAPAEQHEAHRAGVGVHAGPPAPAHGSEPGVVLRRQTHHDDVDDVLGEIRPFPVVSSRFCRRRTDRNGSKSVQRTRQTTTTQKHSLQSQTYLAILLLFLLRFCSKTSNCGLPCHSFIISTSTPISTREGRLLQEIVVSVLSF